MIVADGFPFGFVPAVVFLLLRSLLSTAACSDDDSGDDRGRGGSTGPLFGVVTQLASAEEALS
jgi:hypothetical protein